MLEDHSFKEVTGDSVPPPEGDEAELPDAIFRPRYKAICAQTCMN